MPGRSSGKPPSASTKLLPSSVLTPSVVSNTSPSPWARRLAPPEYFGEFLIKRYSSRSALAVIIFRLCAAEPNLHISVIRFVVYIYNSFAWTLSSPHKASSILVSSATLLRGCDCVCACWGCVNVSRILTCLGYNFPVTSLNLGGVKIMYVAWWGGCMCARPSCFWNASQTISWSGLGDWITISLQGVLEGVYT